MRVKDQSENMSKLGRPCTKKFSKLGDAPKIERIAESKNSADYKAQSQTIRIALAKFLD